MNLLITFLIGLLGGILFQRMKFPAGAMVGSMVFTALYNIMTSGAHVPPETRIFTQIVAGAFIGHSVMKKDVVSLKAIIFPAFLMIFSMITLDMAMGYLIFRITDLDAATALMASAPGGLMDISIISGDVGADSSKVALLQLMRLMVVMAFFPLIIRTVAERAVRRGRRGTAEKVSMDKEEEVIIQGERRIVIPWYKDSEKKRNLLTTAIIAAASGLLGNYTGIPAGAMTFSLLGTAVFNIFTERGFMPIIIRRFTQVLAGILIGSRMTYQDVVSLRTILLPAVILLTGIIIINFIVGYVMHRITGIDFTTCQLASTPGGLSDTVLISGDLGADQNKVAVLQLFRYIFVVALFPVIIRFLLRYI